MTDIELRIVFLVSLAVLTAIAWAHRREIAARRLESALTPITPALDVSGLHRPAVLRRGRRP